MEAASNHPCTTYKAVLQKKTETGEESHAEANRHSEGVTKYRGWVWSEGEPGEPFKSPAYLLTVEPGMVARKKLLLKKSLMKAQKQPSEGVIFFLE